MGLRMDWEKKPGRCRVGRPRRLGFALVLVAAAIQLASVAAAQSSSSGTKKTSDAWPDLLVLHDGSRVSDAQQFTTHRRQEILHDLAENVFGRTPATAVPIAMRVTSTDSHALGGAAIRKQITIALGSVPNARELHLLLYLPVGATKPVPVFVGLNFNGNQTVNADPGIDLNDVWIPDPALASTPIAKELGGHIRRRATEASRGGNASEWPVVMILKAGYGLATLYGGDIEPDFAVGIGYGIRPLLFKPGQMIPAADEWGAIGAWAWGMSRAVDYLETDPAVDRNAILAIGHSRFGKAALWAGAQDSRFAMVISNESGQGGATLSHRETGEQVSHLNIAFPYWFCANYHHFTGRTDQMPVDGHFVLALIAPRPLFVASAQADPFSDPFGEFLSVAAASQVYRLFGEEGVSADANVEPGKPLGKGLRYYVRAGGHAILDEDWEQYIAFANEMLNSRAHGGRKTNQPNVTAPAN
jgi:hypothetical protein